MISGNQPRASPSTTCRLAVSSPPALIERESAEKISSSAFWITIDSPKVTSRGGRMSLPSVRFSTPRCKA